MKDLKKVIESNCPLQVNCATFESTERMDEKRKQKLDKTRMQSEVKSQVRISKSFSSTILIHKKKQIILPEMTSL